jgi:hypothetical protein
MHAVGIIRRKREKRIRKELEGGINREAKKEKVGKEKSKSNFFIVLYLQFESAIRIYKCFPY